MCVRDDTTMGDFAVKLRDGKIVSECDRVVHDDYGVCTVVAVGDPDGPADRVCIVKGIGKCDPWIESGNESKGTTWFVR